MKNSLLLICLLPLLANAQIYLRTGENLGFYASSQVSMLKSSLGQSEKTSLSVNGGLIHMFRPGIYGKFGYQYSDIKNLSTLRDQQIPNSLHSLEGSVLLDKNLFKLVNGKLVRNSCHYLSVGLILGPEYRFHLFPQRNNLNNIGEFSALGGISLCHVYKNRVARKQSKSIQYDLFCRYGVTPLIETEYANGQLETLKRFEFGIGVRYIRHKVYNFLN
jgi:hypothetical protein